MPSNRGGIVVCPINAARRLRARIASAYRQIPPNGPNYPSYELRSVVPVCRQRELEDGASGHVRRSPKPSAVSFDDRIADRQSHAHASGLRRVERLEDALPAFGG